MIVQKMRSGAIRRALLVSLCLISGVAFFFTATAQTETGGKNKACVTIIADPGGTPSVSCMYTGVLCAAPSDCGNN